MFIIKNNFHGNLHYYSHTRLNIEIDTYITIYIYDPNPYIVVVYVSYAYLLYKLAVMEKHGKQLKFRGRRFCDIPCIIIMAFTIIYLK